MRNRRATGKGSERGRDEAGGWLGARLAALGWGRRDAAACTVGAAGAVAIMVNALFLQSGPHPAPLLKASLLPVAGVEATNTIVVPRPRPPEATPGKTEGSREGTKEGTKDAPKLASSSSTPAPAPHGDAIADLLSSRRVMALQRALAQYGYGQIKPTGVVDAETRAAIEKFERERRLPVTGQPSERVARELTSLIGRPLD